MKNAHLPRLTDQRVIKQVQMYAREVLHLAFQARVARAVKCKRIYLTGACDAHATDRQHMSEHGKTGELPRWMKSAWVVCRSSTVLQSGNRMRCAFPPVEKRLSGKAPDP